jgi:hypothetical protein
MFVPLGDLGYRYVSEAVFAPGLTYIVDDRSTVSLQASASPVLATDPLTFSGIELGARVVYEKRLEDQHSLSFYALLRSLNFSHQGINGHNVQVSLAGGYGW